MKNKKLFDYMMRDDIQDLAIVSHVNPDGDALGSQLGLGMILQGLGKHVVLANDSALPQDFSYLEGFARIVPFDQIETWPPTIITVDCGDYARTDLPAALSETHTILNIDHHASNTCFGTYHWVDDQAPATCQIIAEMVRDAELPCTPAVATALYTGLSTDTGSFKYDRTSAETMRIAAYLMEHGADIHALRRHVYESISRSGFDLQRHILGALRYDETGCIAFSALRYEDHQRLSPDTLEFGGVVAQMKEIQGVQVAMLIREQADGRIKVSLRSKAACDVAAIAVAFGGGGHRLAAGLTIDGPLETAEAQLLPALQAACAEENV